MPDDNKKPTVFNDQSSPIIFTEDTVPPFSQGNPAPPAAVGIPETRKEDSINPSPADTINTTSGSAAPTPDIITDTVMPAVVTTGTPKKKFAGGKVIATILGLFLLVGGIGAGVFLTGQNQDIREKADYACGPNMTWTITVNSPDGVCVPNPTDDNGNYLTRCEQLSLCANTSCRQEYNSECTSDDTPTPPPTTAEPSTAQCQNIKAYSTNNWTLLTPAVLSTLRTGDSVNLCVTGVASSGSFDKAKFTINGAVQEETTTKRPGGEDFCQLYVIPAATTTFNITAQINHATLGWK